MFSTARVATKALRTSIIAPSEPSTIFCCSVMFSVATISTYMASLRSRSSATPKPTTPRAAFRARRRSSTGPATNWASAVSIGCATAAILLVELL